MDKNLKTKFKDEMKSILGEIYYAFRDLCICFTCANPYVKFCAKALKFQTKVGKDLIKFAA